MKKIYGTLMVALFATLLVSPLFAQKEQQLREERVRASYLLAFGRQPNSGELTHWTGQGNYSVEQLAKFHSDFLKSNTDERKKVAARSFADAFGYAANSSQINQNASAFTNYTEMMNNHVKYLRTNPSAWNDMIAKVYWNVCKRWATDNDRKSWKQSDARPYMVVAAVVDVWNKENSWFAKWFVPGNSHYVTQIVVSNPVANEAARVVAAGGGNAVASGGGNVIAPGGGNIIAPIGGSVVAAGGANVVAAGGLN